MWQLLLHFIFQNELHNQVITTDVWKQAVSFGIKYKRMTPFQVVLWLDLRELSTLTASWLSLPVTASQCWKCNQRGALHHISTFSYLDYNHFNHPIQSNSKVQWPLNGYNSMWYWQHKTVSQTFTETFSFGTGPSMIPLLPAILISPPKLSLGHSVTVTLARLLLLECKKHASYRAFALPLPSVRNLWLICLGSSNYYVSISSENVPQPLYLALTSITLFC